MAIESSLEMENKGSLSLDWFLISVEDDIAVTRFREYLRIRTEQPTPDYKSCSAFLKGYAAELGLDYKVIEVFNR